MIANARMYALAPGLLDAWRTLFERVSRISGLALRYVAHEPPAPIHALWAREDCGCVFICGYPYARNPGGRLLLGAPVPQGERYGGRPVYYTEFVVRADAPARELSDTFGGRLAHMLPESNSGYNAPRHYLMRHGPAGTDACYRPAGRETVTPRAIIDAVLEGDADIGVVDSYVLDLLRRDEPGLLRGLKTLAVTPASPIPPLVASSGAMDAESAGRLQSALLGIHEDAEAGDCLSALGLLRFAVVVPEDYMPLLAMARDADAAGFALTRTGGGRMGGPEHG